MNTNPNQNLRQSAGTISADGKKVGGQFAGKPGGQSAPEVQISFTGHARIDRDAVQIPEYPASLPEPDVHSSLDGGRWETTVTVGDHSVTFWEDSGDHYNTHEDSMGAEPDDLGMDEETLESFLEWGRAVHDAVDVNMYGVQVAASDYTMVRQVIDHILGKTEPVDAVESKAEQIAEDLMDELARRAESPVDLQIIRGLLADAAKAGLQAR